MGNKKEKGGITRRKLLTLLVTTLGGVAALKLLDKSNLAQKISPIEISEVRAADGDPVIVGNSHTGTKKTNIERTAGTGASGVAFEAIHTGLGFGLIGQSSSGKGVHGFSTDDCGVWGHSDNYIGVFGESLSSTEAGVKAQNVKGGFGLEAYSEFSDAIRARTNASLINGVGVQGFGNVVADDGPAGTGVRGVGSNIGVRGESDYGHGVSGESINSRGIFGKSSSGSGVYGESTSGNGIYAKSTSGTALHVEGKNYFKSAERTTIPANVRSHVIDVPIGVKISTNAMIFVTIMNNSSNIGVRWVEKLSEDQFQVHLTGLSRTDMDIGYFIVN